MTLRLRTVKLEGHGSQKDGQTLLSYIHLTLMLRIFDCCVTLVNGLAYRIAAFSVNIGSNTLHATCCMPPP